MPNFVVTVLLMYGVNDVNNVCLGSLHFDSTIPTLKYALTSTNFSDMVLIYELETTIDTRTLMICLSLEFNPLLSTLIWEHPLRLLLSWDITGNSCGICGKLGRVSDSPSYVGVMLSLFLPFVFSLLSSSYSVDSLSGSSPYSSSLHAAIFGPHGTNLFK